MSTAFVRMQIFELLPFQIRPGSDPRRIIREWEGDNDVNVLGEYADPNSDRYAAMLEEIRKRQNFTSLRYHRLDDLIKSIGIDACQVCTYCFNGVE